jgi:tetratricopeptide (TPR) repeat protein
MVGNLAEASQRLLRASETGEPIQAYRALYLLGRISLLTGDFRQAKEYFERAVDGNRLPAGNWMALAGIGDALYAGGIYEEAIRRYRIAQGKAGGEVEKAIIDLKMALCQNALGKDEEARLNLRAALKKIPVLSGWVGQEEEFYHSMAMVGISVREGKVSQIYVVAGPVKGDFNAAGVVSADVQVRELRKGGKTYLEYGPLTDSVEAMILSESIRNSFEVNVEVINR